MFENMVEELVAAQEQDRRREIARMAMLAEALRGSGPRDALSRSQRRRAAVASALRALAFRLAPAQRDAPAANAQP